MEVEVSGFSAASCVSTRGGNEDVDGDYFVGEYYNFNAPRDLDARVQARLAHGRKRVLFLTIGNPPGFYVDSDNGNMMGHFKEPGCYAFHLSMRDSDGHDHPLEYIRINVVAAPAFVLHVVPGARHLRDHPEPGVTDITGDVEELSFYVGEEYRLAPRVVDRGPFTSGNRNTTQRGWGVSLISSAHLRVLRANMGRTCRWANEIKQIERTATHSSPDGL